jgi:hypothetical protein
MGSAAEAHEPHRFRSVIENGLDVLKERGVPDAGDTVDLGGSVHGRVELRDRVSGVLVAPEVRAVPVQANQAGRGHEVIEPGKKGQ